MKSIQKKLSTVRKPRIHITYDVETEGAVEKKELPFVVGVLGDFSGNSPGQPKPPFKKRKFIQIDPDNFDEVMQKIQPGVELDVENTLTPEDTRLKISLQFHSMEDFEPHQIAQQVPALKKLLDTRKKLNELLSKADISDDLEHLLETILTNKDHIGQLSTELTQSMAPTEEDPA